MPSVLLPGLRLPRSFLSFFWIQGFVCHQKLSCCAKRIFGSILPECLQTPVFGRLLSDLLKSDILWGTRTYLPEQLLKVHL